MAISKGQSNCQAERYTAIEGFKDLFAVVKKAKADNEDHQKARLYDIMSNPDDSPEEKKSQSFLYEYELEKQEESDIKIRRAILIGLYSFWEVSMKELCEHYKVGVTTGSKRPGANDYVKTIYGDDVPQNVTLILDQLKELRNYMTHGSNNKDRKQVIKILVAEHPEFGVKGENEYHLSSYEGLEIIEGLVESTLNQAEEHIRNVLNIPPCVSDSAVLSEDTNNDSPSHK